MNSPLILIDASSYFFRAFHALPPLTNSKGQPTGAIYGVANMIKKLIKDYQPKRLAVIFDSKGKTFRDDWYPEYKAHRPPMPSELSGQFEPLIQLLKAMGLPILIIEGVEADDVIGTLSRRASEQGEKVVISTGDKDMAQLVNEHVSLINTMSNTSMDIAGVKEKFGVEPNQIIDYLTLMGDSVDNIPGINKCGPKTAVKWLSEYKTLDNLITHAHDIGGRVGECLREGLPILPLSKKLVTIKTDCDLPLTFSELLPGKANQDQLIELVRELEFKTWLKELLSQPISSNDSQQIELNFSLPNYELITTLEQFEPVIAKLKECKAFCISAQTNSIDPIQAEIIGISLSIKVGTPFYIPLKGSELKQDYILNTLKIFLENKDIQKIGHNLKDDYIVFKNHGICLKNMAFDTMLESYVLNSGGGRHDLESLSLKYLGHKTISFEDIAGKGSKKLSFDKIPISTAAPYAAEKTDLILQLHNTLYALMDEHLRKVFHKIEMPLSQVLGDMERHGVLIDLATLSQHGLRLKARILTLEEEALQLSGQSFNLNSPKQLQEILFEQQKLPIISRTPTGQPSTGEAVLQELSFDYRLAAVILEYRSLSKLVSTYIDALPKRVNSGTLRVHTCYNQAVAATGRLSSSEPNLQNIPIRSEEGRLIRKAFIAPPNCVVLAADYSQIELRIMAHLSQDSNLLKAFAQGWDIHTATASEIFQMPLEDVSAEHRRRAKAVNFGLIYGMSAFGLAKQLGIERQDAQYYMDTYFQRYPGVLEYMEKTRRQAHKYGYVETLFGRRLYLPEINTRNMMRQKAAERAAINAPMQGTAADIIKKAMLAIAKWQDESKQASAKMIMQVHDELIFEIAEDQVENCSSVIRQLMEKTVILSVPLLVSLGVGKNWDEAHK